LGLRAAEALGDNLWPENPDTGSFTNEYRSCVASLSVSLQAKTAALSERRAQDQCRSDGYEAGSPELAVCILSAVETGAEPLGGQLAAVGHAGVIGQTRASDPALTSTTLQRVRLACAEIGLDPDEGAFTTCVEGLTRALSAKFMNEGYRN
jgi:hypothetical protein